jgi:hypothetical protein
MSKPRPSPPFCHPRLRRHTAFVPPPLPAIKGAPPLFFLLRPLHRHRAAVLAITEPPRIAHSSSCPTASTPPQASCHRVLPPQLLRPRQWPLLRLADVFTPPPIPSAINKPSGEPLLSVATTGHSTTDHRSSVGQILPVSHRRRWGEELPCFRSWAKKTIWTRPCCRARPSASVDPSPLQQCHFAFFLSNYSNSILIKVQTS